MAAAVPHQHHHHAGLHHHHHGRSGSRRALAWSLGFTVVLGAIQVAAALAFSSVALLSDAAHNLSDGAAIGLALLAAWGATMPASGRRTFGLQRLEIIAALLNGALLVVLGALILLESLSRLAHPQAVDGLGVAAIGLLGVVANGIPVVLMLRAGGGGHGDLNLRAALVHAATDVLASLGAMLAGLIIWQTGWDRADPIAAILVSLLMMASAWPLLKTSVGVLMEVAPPGVDVEAIGRRLCAERGVRTVHDLHVWTITSGFPALSAHVVVEPSADQHALLHRLQDAVRDECGIEHVTLQLDVDHRLQLLQIHRRGCPEAPAPRPAG